MQKLLSLLQRLERERRPIASGELLALMVDEVGYKDSTARTYRSKILDGKVLFAGDDEGTVVVRHAVAMSGDSFAAMMTQTKPEVSLGMEVETEEDWRDAMEVLARHGLDRGWKLAASEKAVFDQLIDAPSDRPVAFQGQLFDN